VEEDIRTEYPRRISKGEYTEPPPWPNIEKIKAITNENRIAIISMLFSSIFPLIIDY